jgi:DNA-3-methyladenine glycosylase II
MSTPEFLRARRHLSRRDEIMKTLVKKVGPCTLQTNDDHFAVLARSIIAQQISTKAALAIGGRVLKALGRRGLRPAAVLDLDDETMRAAGLSANKQKSLRDLAQKCHSKEVPLKDLPHMSDEDVIAALIPVRGIGVWTAQMFLMFSLGRRDVLPVADFGLRSGVQKQYGLADLASKAELEALGEPWRPFRSIATWYVWRSLGPVPQSEPKAD